MAIKRIVILAAILTMWGLAGGLGTELAAENERSITISFAPGSAYSHKVRFGLISMSLAPQIAVWIETADGRYIGTIYVTGKSAAAGWRAAGGARRPEALPVWSHARDVAAPDGQYMPDKAHRLPDAVSGATPKSAIAWTWEVPADLAAGSYRIRAELNSSYDWNDAYPDKLPKTDPRWSEVNGQPSIVWEGALEIGAAAAKARLEPVGTGSLRGEDGGLKPGLEGLTTARDLAASISAEYRP